MKTRYYFLIDLMAFIIAWIWLSFIDNIIIVILYAIFIISTTIIMKNERKFESSSYSEGKK